VFPCIAYGLLHGGFGLRTVDTNLWGGLMLTLVLAVVGIAVALPFGILLALGRRSHMPIISSLSTVYIEFWRAVPLITVLFMASVMLPLFVAGEVEFDKLLRALIGIIMFQSAYVAEVVRGGLQAIPKGQYEAGDALGLSYWKVMGLIIMPQALKITIPSLVNTFISLFKDTSLVLIIGLFDLLAISKVALADPDWLGYSTEAYVFIALIFWMFCFGMSRYSIYLERKLHTGHKR
jgi:general L-amino acid transport system permease protein